MRAHLSGTALLLLAVSACASGGGTPATEPAMPQAPTGAAMPADQPAASGGSHTQAQATSGEQVFDENCSACHSTREFYGSEFQYSWGSRNARSFFRLVSRTMPDDAPGSLTEEQYVDVLAYILDLNGYPAGTTPLTADQEAMRALRLDAHVGGGEQDGGSSR